MTFYEMIAKIFPWLFFGTLISVGFLTKDDLMPLIGIAVEQCAKIVY